MFAVIFYCLLPLLLYCEDGSFNITTPGPHVIAVKSSGFEINICANEKQTSKFCYGGKPTGDQGVNCGPNYCGIVTSTTETGGRMIQYGGASAVMETSCVKVKIQENKQTISGMNKAGTCTWDREKDGRLVIWTQFDTSSPIEVRYGNYHADEAKLQGNSMVLYIVIPMVVGGVILVAVIIFGVCMYKKGKCCNKNKKDVDHEMEVEVLNKMGGKKENKPEEKAAATVGESKAMIKDGKVMERKVNTWPTVSVGDSKETSGKNMHIVVMSTARELETKVETKPEVKVDEKGTMTDNAVDGKENVGKKEMKDVGVNTAKEREQKKDAKDVKPVEATGKADGKTEDASNEPVKQPEASVSKEQAVLTPAKTPVPVKTAVQRTPTSTTPVPMPKKASNEVQERKQKPDDPKKAPKVKNDKESKKKKKKKPMDPVERKKKLDKQRIDMYNSKFRRLDIEEVSADVRDDYPVSEEAFDPDEKLETFRVFKPDKQAPEMDTTLQKNANEQRIFDIFKYPRKLMEKRMPDPISDAVISMPGWLYVCGTISLERCQEMQKQYNFRVKHAATVIEWFLFVVHVRNAVSLVDQLISIADKTLDRLALEYPNEADRMAIIRDPQTPGFVWARQFAKQHVEELKQRSLKTALKKYPLSGLVFLLFSDWPTKEEKIQLLRTIKVLFAEYVNHYGEDVGRVRFYPFPLLYRISTLYNNGKAVFPTESQYMNILLPPKTIVKPSDVSITGVQTDLNVAVDNLNVAVVFEQHEAINLVYVDMDKEATKEWTPEEIENKRFQLKWKETRCRMEVYNVIRKFLPPLPPGFKGLPKVEPKALTTATEERVRPEDMVDGGHLEETKDEPEKPEEKPETEGKYLKTEENPPNREPEEKPETEGKYLKTEENPPNQHESATIQENGGKQGNEDAKV